jgi:hypothetical protein
MNTAIPYKAGSCLSSLSTVIFSRIILLHGVNYYCGYGTLLSGSKDGRNAKYILHVRVFSDFKFVFLEHCTLAVWCLW